MHSANDLVKCLDMMVGKFVDSMGFNKGLVKVRGIWKG